MEVAIKFFFWLIGVFSMAGLLGLAPTAYPPALSRGILYPSSGGGSSVPGFSR